MTPGISALALIGRRVEQEQESKRSTTSLLAVEVVVGGAGAAEQ